jgi:multisubunit Na+/H+ antiporter MnhG subunit
LEGNLVVKEFMLFGTAFIPSRAVRLIQFPDFYCNNPAFGLIIAPSSFVPFLG